MTPTQQLRADVDNLLTTVGALKEKLDTLFVTKGNDRDLGVSAPAQSFSTKVTQELGESDPVKVEYVEKVHQKLNKDFGTHVRFSDRGFAFTIIVPEKYNSFTAEQKASGAIDMRTRVIPFAEGVLGVEMWAEAVFKNFNPDVQAMITADRTRESGL